MTTEKQPSSIEKIRAEVEGIRKEHSGGQDAYPFQERMICHDCHQLWPCEALRLAEDKLRLAELLERIRFDASAQPDGKASPPIGYVYVDQEWPERIEALFNEVAR